MQQEQLALSNKQFAIANSTNKSFITTYRNQEYMSEQQDDLAKEFQDLFQKTAEANKIFLSESARFVSGLSSGKLGSDKLAAVQKGALTDAFTTYIKLGIQYTSSLIDLGLDFTKRLNEELGPKENDSPPQDPQQPQKPAFTLKATGAAGSIAKAEFLLDSDKKEPILCHIKQTEYTSQDDTKLKAQFDTSFSPQFFELLPGKPQKVEIIIAIPLDTKEGIYLSNMQVEGFEHSFFSLYLHVTGPQDLNMQPE
ncbi:MAG: hypothetical protein JWR72_1553 [Flavisolibacter sp.]|nr:hypothetical protein [Flavisolibacter sp.]